MLWIAKAIEEERRNQGDREIIHEGREPEKEGVSGDLYLKTS
jgi:hypothetical protein